MPDGEPCGIRVPKGGGPTLESDRLRFTMNTESESRLKRNTEVYDSLTLLLRDLSRRVDGESVLLAVEAIAQFAANYHVGRFADGAVENPAFEVGANLNIATGRSATTCGRQASRRSTVLHVATGATLFGGVGRTILNWISADDQHRHLLALTKDHNVSPMLEQAVAVSGGAVTRLRGRLLERAAALRDLAHDADLIFLHHGRADALPVVAFAATGLPPVGLVNQADHTFWLGKSVADVVVHQRVVGLPLSVERRSSQHNVSLPIPLRDPFESTSVDHSKERAREALGISSSQLMLVSVGRAIKFIPNATHNFFTTVTKVLERHRDAHVYLVGPTIEEIVTVGATGCSPAHPLCRLPAGSCCLHHGLRPVPGKLPLRLSDVVSRGLPGCATANSCVRAGSTVVRVSRRERSRPSQ